MEIKKYEVNGVMFEFVCEYWETRYSWGHEVHVFRNDIEIASNKVRYYNRTWEYFRYQTCMLGAINNAMSVRINTELENYKYKHNLSRFRKGEKDVVLEDIKKNNADYLELAELYSVVKNPEHNY